MTQTPEKPGGISCEEFQQHLPELIGAGEPIENHPHLRGCPLCSALMADLLAIADAARQLLPVDQPKDDLWSRIESAIRAEEDTPDPTTH